MTMKKILLIILFLMALTNIKANEIALDGFALGESANSTELADISSVRELVGGTIFDITYEGAWNVIKKGAFEYACKIWAENLPQTLPIKVTARMSTIRGNAKTKVSAHTFTLPEGYSDGKNHLSSEIKAATFMEYMRGNMVTYNQLVDEQTLMGVQDIIITFDKDFVQNECSLSLDAGLVPSDKYDFVTLAMREIGRGLGLFSTITANTQTQTLNAMSLPPTQFEQKILDALDATDNAEAYTKATAGTLTLSNGMVLYAPTPWVNGVSLNYFIPQEDNKITQLLSYPLERGVVCRDISDDYHPLFNGLGWRANYTVGTGGTSSVECGTTETVVPYNGTLVLNTPSPVMSISDNDNGSIAYLDETGDKPYNQFSIDNYRPYHYYYGYENSSVDGWTLSVLKKDGTWDVIYYQVGAAPLNANLSNITFNYDRDSYARTCDGYLRARATFFHNQNPGKIYDVTYLALDYLPQTPEIELINDAAPAAYSISNVALDDDDFFYDVKIGVKNLEGTTFVEAQQITEWDDYPFGIDVDDFKKGYFITSIDKEAHTSITVTSYNSNGSSQSDVLTIDPLISAQQSYNVSISDDNLHIERESAFSNAPISADFEINSLDVASERCLNGELTGTNNSVDVSSLKPGLYVLKIKQARNTQYYKFLKR